MHFADILVLVLLLLGPFLGVKKDLAQSIYQIVRVGMTLFLSVHYHQNMGRLLMQGGILSPPVAEFLAFILVSILVFFSCTLIIMLLNAIVEIKFITLIERPLGGILGFFSMAILCTWSGLLILLLPLSVVPQTFLGGSVTSMVIVSGADFTYHTLFQQFAIKPAFDPDHFHKRIAPNLKMP